MTYVTRSHFFYKNINPFRQFADIDYRERVFKTNRITVMIMNDLRIHAKNSYNQIEKSRKSNNSKKNDGYSTNSVENSVTSDDRIEISDKAKILSRIANIPDIRHAKIDLIREKVKNGEYLSDEKVKSALKQLIRDL